MSEEQTFEDGIVAGELKAIRDIVGNHKDRLDNHSNRMRALERIIWALGGILVFLEIWPRLVPFLKMAN